MSAIMTKRHRLPVLAGAGLLVLGLAACGDQDASGGGQSMAGAEQTAHVDSLSDIDVCALLSPDDLAAATGLVVSAGSPQDLSGVKPARGCSYGADVPGTEDGYVEVMVQVSVWSDPAQLAQYFDDVIADLGEPLPGDQTVGDETYWRDGAMVRWGRIQMMVEIMGDHGQDPETHQARTVALAEQAISRI